MIQGVQIGRFDNAYCNLFYVQKAQNFLEFQRWQNVTRKREKHIRETQWSKTRENLVLLLSKTNP